MTAPSLIAIVDFATAAADRPAAIAQLERERPDITAMPGCIGFRVFADGPDGTGITVLHEWRDPAAFERYLGSDAFARSGAALRPLMIAPPTSRRFQVELLETVF